MDFEPDWIPPWIRENAARLRDLRIERGISRKQLADAAGVNVSQVSRAEAGQNIRISTLLRIYGGLGYRIELELQETCEEVEDLLTKEAWRRDGRRHAGLLMGKWWR